MKYVGAFVGLWIILSAFEDVLDAWMPNRAFRIAVGAGIFLMLGGFSILKKWSR